MEEQFKVRVSTPAGPVCGYREDNDLGTHYHFQGIPYAKPPIGNLRFLPPVPIPPWTSELDCTKECPRGWMITAENEADLKDLTISGSEDCLYINVSTPTLKPDKPLPVIVWICCYRFSIKIDHLIDHSTITNAGVVFVKCNFRLGPFGFLSAQIPAAPGNAGLKDLVLGLKWIQTNISSFGGNPDNVTLVGSSSGASLVHFLVLSQTANGLFHKAILQSGCALNSWALDRNPIQSMVAFAKELGITTLCQIEMVDIMKSMPARTLMEVYRKKLQDNTGTVRLIFGSPFSPCVEEEFEGQQAFMTKNPYRILKSGNYNKVPIIFGCANIEALLHVLDYDLQGDFESCNRDIRLLVPKSFFRPIDSQSKDIGEEIKKFYIGDKVTESKKHKYLQFLSDYHFIYYLNTSVAMHTHTARECPVYYYILNYAGDLEVPKLLDPMNSPGHCTDIAFLFRIVKSGVVYKGSRDSVKTQGMVVKMWTNFAKYGNPTPDADDPQLQITWDPVESKTCLNYLSISPDLTKGRNPFLERMKFWDHLHEQYEFPRFLAHCSEKGIELA